MLNPEETILITRKAENALSDLNSAIRSGKPYRGRGKNFIKCMLPLLYKEEFTWLPRATYLEKDATLRSL